MPYEQLLLNGESITIYTEKEWFELFTNYCQKIYGREWALTEGELK